MGNENQLGIPKQGSKQWNSWQQEHPRVEIYPTAIEEFLDNPDVNVGKAIIEGWYEE